MHLLRSIAAIAALLLSFLAGIGVTLMQNHYDAVALSRGQLRSFNAPGDHACPFLYRNGEARLDSLVACRARADAQDNYYCPDDFVIMVITSSNTVDRYHRCNATWLPELVQQGFHVLRVAAAAVPALPEVVGLNMPAQHDNQIRDLTVRGMQLARQLYPSAKWYMKVDDDAYLYGGNLIARFNMYVQGQDRLNASKPVAVGKIFPEGADSRMPVKFLMGGAGWVQSRPALDIAEPAMADPGHACGRSTAEDVAWSECWRQLGVQLVDMPGMVPVQTWEAWRWLHWMNGAAGPSKLPITFHWVKKEMEMIKLHNCKFRFPMQEVERAD